jgi:hypothetical protein
VWNQFLGADGKPLYPQRTMLLGPMFTKGAAGSIPTGRFEGKMILVESLWDREAWPWNADWFRRQVESYMGSSTREHLRIWLVDHALHGAPEYLTRTVNYTPVLQQALRDLSAWVEKCVAPPSSTAYQVQDGQVIVPSTAQERGGVQPVVDLKVNGGVRQDIHAGDVVTFTGTISVPQGAGSLVAAQWDFDGKGTFPVTSRIAKGARQATVTVSHRFDTPGTFFPALRGVSQRQGDERTPFARIQNLGRVRIVVE